MAEQAMLLFAVLIGVNIICCIVAVAFNSRRGKDGKKEPAKLKINIPSKDGSSSTTIKDDLCGAAKEESESLDSIYANSVGKKLCPYCETVNNNEAENCCACGNRM